MDYTTLPMRFWISKTLLISATLVCAMTPVACDSGGDSSSGGPTGKEPSTVTEGTSNDSAGLGVQEGARPAAALSRVRQADRAAAGWREDAKLYAIASVTPQVDAKGRAPGWLYTYVSSSEKAVTSVSVSGGKAQVTPQQPLPAQQIQDISRHTLPLPGRLLDSNEAVARAAKFRRVLEDGTGAEASAGLDSFSTGKPVWIFSTAKGEKRVEERITATTGS